MKKLIFGLLMTTAVYSISATFAMDNSEEDIKGPIKKHKNDSSSKDSEEDIKEPIQPSKKHKEESSSKDDSNSESSSEGNTITYNFTSYTKTDNPFLQLELKQITSKKRIKEIDTKYLVRKQAKPKAWETYFNHPHVRKQNMRKLFVPDDKGHFLFDSEEFRRVLPSWVKEAEDHVETKFSQEKYVTVSTETSTKTINVPAVHKINGELLPSPPPLIDWEKKFYCDMDDKKEHVNVYTLNHFNTHGYYLLKLFVSKEIAGEKLSKIVRKYKTKGTLKTAKLRYFDTMEDICLPMKNDGNGGLKIVGTTGVYYHKINGQLIYIKGTLEHKKKAPMDYLMFHFLPLEFRKFHLSEHHPEVETFADEQTNKILTKMQKKFEKTPTKRDTLEPTHKKKIEKRNSFTSRSVESSFEDDNGKDKENNTKKLTRARSNTLEGQHNIKKPMNKQNTQKDLSKSLNNTSKKNVNKSKDDKNIKIEIEKHKEKNNTNNN